MIYSKLEEEQINKVLALFENYIRNSPYIDITCSEKTEYHYFSVDFHAGINDKWEVEPKFIKSAEMLCGMMFMEIGYDVVNFSGKKHNLYEADEEERNEIERRLKPYIKQLPKYEKLLEEIYL